MRERGPALIALALLLVLVAGTWWAADYAQRAIPIDPPGRVTHEPDSWAHNFVMIRTDANGVAVNRLEGITMRHYPDDDSYEIDQVKATGQQADAPVTVGTADLATMNADGTRIVMDGNAHIHRLADATRSALDVTSDQLILYPDDDVVETGLPARVINGQHIMHGTGMRYDNKTRQLTVFSSSDVKISGKESLTGSKRADQKDTQP